MLGEASMPVGLLASLPSSVPLRRRLRRKSRFVALTDRQTFYISWPPEHNELTHIVLESRREIDQSLLEPGKWVFLRVPHNTLQLIPHQSLFVFFSLAIEMSH